MKNQTKSNWQKQMIFAAITTVVFMFAATSFATAQDLNQTYVVGDRVEVQRAEGWLKGEVVEVDDRTGRAWYTIRYEWEGSRYNMYALPKDLRLIAGAKRPAQTPVPPPAIGQPVATQAGKPENTDYKYKPGDRVECDRASNDSWEKGTVMPFQKNDFTDGHIFRVRLDDFASKGMYLGGHICEVESMRLLAGAASYKNEATAVPVGKATVDGDDTLSADRPILDCPVKQPAVKNGARPNTELFKKIIRCEKGERPAAKGGDGAVTVDVTALQPGATRPWIYGRDIGGKPGTIIHPVKTTFHYKTFYRSGTQVSQNWISIINFFVNAFGEWETGSEESIKMGETVNIPRDQ